VLATEEREHEQGQDRQEQQEQVVSPPRQAEEVVEEDAEKAKERDRLAAVAAKLAKGKRLNFQEAVLIFNAKPTRAVKQLITNGFIRVYEPLLFSSYLSLVLWCHLTDLNTIFVPSQSDPDDIARFLHSANNSLDKEQLGILLAEKYVVTGTDIKVRLKLTHFSLSLSCSIDVARISSPRYFRPSSARWTFTCLTLTLLCERYVRVRTSRTLISSHLTRMHLVHSAALHVPSPGRSAEDRPNSEGLGLSLA
jgi:hypothetical protein